jgi:biotin transporter BioY
VSANRTAAAANPARRLLATVLTCEAIVIALAIPVAISVQHVDGAVAGWVCGGLAVLCVLLAGLLRHPWAIAVGSGFQVLIIATGFMVKTMFFLGVLFGLLWVTAIWLGRKAENAEAR